MQEPEPLEEGMNARSEDASHHVFSPGDSLPADLRSFLRADRTSTLTKLRWAFANRPEYFPHFQSFQTSLLRTIARSRRLKELECEPEAILSEVWDRVAKGKGCEYFRDRGPGSLHRYLVGVANHVIQDLLKSKRTIKRGGGTRSVSLSGTAMVSETEAGPAVEGLTPLDIYQAEELFFLAMNWFRENLSARDFQVCWLAFALGESDPSIARQVQCSEAAVRNVRRRASLAASEKLTEWLQLPE